MDKRVLKVNFSKAGTGIGAKLTLPVTELRKLGITQEERDIILEVDEKKKRLIIKKFRGVEELWIKLKKLIEW